MSPESLKGGRVAVVVPCYRVKETIERVLEQMPAGVDAIYCVDDACPERSGRYVEEVCKDPRVTVIYHDENQGVGGATVTGFRRALESGADVVVKVDGDGQMDPALLPQFVRPILEGRADCTKGNRFYWLRNLEGMPPIRVLGNSILTFMTKLSTGYWNVFDPTNGYVAIHGAILRNIPLDALSRGYFFESDLLFQLAMIRAAVLDIPMKAKYGDERSSLLIGRIVGPFLRGHLRNLLRRVVYNYFLRDFQLASLELVLGLLALLFGVSFGALRWAQSIATDTPATAGTVMIAALAIIIGIQMLLAAVNYDIQNVPRQAVHPNLTRSRDTA